MQRFPFYLAGQCYTPNQDLVVYDKYTREPIANAALATSEHMEKAVVAASNAREAMQRTTGLERKRVLNHCIARIRQSRADFVEALIREAGKPIQAAEAELDRCIETFEVASQEAVRIGGDVLPMDGSVRGAGVMGFTRRFPVGVCSFITPFNFPLNLVAHKVAPAIAAGCPFILKPASWTPMSALMLGDILAEASLPEGAFSILPTTRSIASPLVTDDRIAMLSFTGSDRVGWQMKQDCGRKRVCLELGGNACCIVEEDVDWKPLIPKLIQAAFGQSGQSCISLQRLFVHESHFDALTAELVQQTSKIGVGDPNLPSTVVGPMIDPVEVDRVMTWIKQAVGQGARELLASKHLAGTSVLSPGILTNVPESTSLCCDEVFGPVLIVERFADFEAVLAAINRSRFGLQTGLFTHDIRKIWRAWETLEVGGVVVGDTPNTRFDSMPYGGVKASGQGREGVRYAIEEMTTERLLLYRNS
jgi:acyl-CoA reductase-like NAD-dependent aldehyde dehydrogenase